MNPEFQKGGGGGGGPTQSPSVVWSDSKSADVAASAEAWGRKWKEDGATSAQLRRYFGEVKRLELLIQQEGWEKHALSLKLLKAKAAYALRVNANQRRSTVDFLQKCVNRVNTKEDFDYFVLYFEAALGFAYGFGISDRER